MTNNKKPRSKRPAKKAAIKAMATRAVRTPQPLTPGPDRQLIAGIAACVAQLAAEVKAANQKLDYLVVRLAPAEREEWRPLVEEAEEGGDALNPDEPKRSIDERLDALVMSLELLQAEGQAASRRMEAFTAVRDKHEKDWGRFRRSMRAGYQQYLREKDGTE